MRSPSLFLAGAFLSAFLLLPRGASAAEPTADPTIADVVELRSGLVLRGTIVERDPNGVVVIRTATGALRSFPMGEVTYAGPADKSAPMPSHGTRNTAGPRDEGEGEGELVSVELVASNPNASFHVRNATAFSGGYAAVGYKPLCSSPCKTRLPVGVVNLAVSEGKGLPVESSEVLRLEGPSRVDTDYDARSGRRALGWTMLLGGAALMATGPLLARSEYQDCKSYGGSPSCVTRHDTDTDVLVGTGVGGGLLMIVGSFLALAPPSVRFHVTPLARGTAVRGGSLEVSF
jgi:hypothetical protein